MFRIIFGLKISLKDFVIKDTLLNLLANACTWEFHFNVAVNMDTKKCRFSCIIQFHFVKKNPYV